MRLQTAMPARSKVKNCITTPLSFLFGSSSLDEWSTPPLILHRGYDGVQCALPDSSFIRVWSVIQFTSQVLPPSSEKDCSKWGEFVLVFDQIIRTRLALPFGPDVSVS